MITTKRPRRGTWMAYMVVAFTPPFANDDIRNNFNETICKRKNNQRKLTTKVRGKVSSSKLDLGTCRATPRS